MTIYEKHGIWYLLNPPHDLLMFSSEAEARTAAGVDTIMEEDYDND